MFFSLSFFSFSTERAEDNQHAALLVFLFGLMVQIEALTECMRWVLQKD
jgi:hypothetical protein